MNMKNSNTGISLVKREFQVQVYELDMNSKATMASICNYLQESGITHGMMLMDKAGISAEDLVFVLTRLQVRMLRYPLWKEKVVISTWLSPIINRYAIRNFIIETENGETLGLAINSAVPFNLKNRSGSNIEIDVSGVETLEREAPLLHIFEKLESPVTPQFTASIEASYSHCDLYRHVNNVKYIEWCLDTVPEDIYRTHELHEIDINFRSEGNCGDRLTVGSKQSVNNSSAFIHGISNPSNGRELVRMKSVWKEHSSSQ
jgi:acyl-ACP thioesterase